VAAAEGIDTWNIMPPPRPGSAEQVYVAQLAADDAGSTRVLVSGLSDDEAVRLRFNTTALPCFTLWRNTPDESDGYVVGLEPGTNFPNPRSFEAKHGRVVALKPREKWRAEVTMTWLMDTRQVADEERAIRMIQEKQPPQVSPQPREDWSANR
jgi:hypothetical protein